MARMYTTSVSDSNNGTSVRLYAHRKQGNQQTTEKEFFSNQVPNFPMDCVTKQLTD
jgi:hypothetical protein